MTLWCVQWFCVACMRFVCVHACVCACVRVCVCLCACASVCACSVAGKRSGAPHAAPAPTPPPLQKNASPGTLPQLPQLSLLGATLSIKGCQKRSLGVESTLLANDTLRLLTSPAGDALLSVVAPSGVTLQLTEAGAGWLKLSPVCSQLALGAPQKGGDQQPLSPGVPATIALDARTARRVAKCLKFPKRAGPICAREYKARTRATGTLRRFLPGPWSADVRLAVVCDAEAAACV
jgi:hypothetical protein